MDPALLTSKSDAWTTPIDVFNAIDNVFRFTLDAASSDENHLCGSWITKDEDALTQDWGTHRVWLNPPYGRTLPLWMAKALDASRKGALVVCLVPAKTDTRWWREYALQGEVHYFKGRLCFGGTTKSGKPEPATFASALVIFYPAAFTRFFKG